MKSNLEVGMISVLIGAALLGGASRLSSAQSSHMPDCADEIDGDFGDLSTKKCCGNSDCANAVYDVSIRGENCAPGDEVVACDCQALPCTLFQYQGGSCYDASCPTTQGQCDFGTVIASVPYTYDSCSGKACAHHG